MEYTILHAFFRLLCGEKRLNKLIDDGIIHVSGLMRRHFMEMNMGVIKPLNKEEFLTSFHGHQIVVPFDESWVVKEVREVYLKPKHGEVVIDAGAHYGFYTLFASQLVGREGSIYAFEPSSKNFRRLLTNLLLNNVKNTKASNFGLGNSESVRKLYLSSYSGRHSMLPEISDRFEVVTVRRFDHVVEKMGLKRVDLMKVDVEGYEMEVLKGSLRTLKKHKPRLTMACYHYEGEANEIAHWLKEKLPFYTVKKVGLGFVHAVPIKMNKTGSSS